MSYFYGRCNLCQFSDIGCNGSCVLRAPNPNLPHEVGHIEFAPKGCICPPGSEKTCKRSDCGRKDLSVSFSGTVTKIEVKIPGAGE